MAHSKEYKLDDNEIVKLVDHNVRSSVGYYSSDLSREREKVLNYYNAKLPKPHHDGNSKYVSARMSIRQFSRCKLRCSKHSQPATAS